MNTATSGDRQRSTVSTSAVTVRAIVPGFAVCSARQIHSGAAPTSLHLHLKGSN
ncbi:hypothetical protein QRB38_19950 [Mycobacterium avium subsp. hominissuis]|uniref:hypothetical protein n=1 Tax=Mycobacterium avium TaxID=1764 RepID=UPI002665A4E5|nr:hypothetical protein [Mycobacterium avium]MDO2396050.1 hypothetical protein [Mycobacterium avium subsp. hominissuis]